MRESTSTFMLANHIKKFLSIFSFINVSIMQATMHMQGKR